MGFDFSGLKDIGNEFLFWTGVETGKHHIIKELHDWLEQFSDDDLRQMMQQGKFPPIPPVLFREAENMSRFIEKIQIVELLEEFLGPARPSIINIMNEMGQPGWEYMLKLYDYLIDCVKHPDHARVELLSKPGPEMVNATCDVCKGSFPVRKDKVSEIKECPLCHAKA